MLILNPQASSFLCRQNAFMDGMDVELARFQALLETNCQTWVTVFFFRLITPLGARLVSRANSGISCK
jgi:hypothetical protein